MEQENVGKIYTHETDNDQTMSSTSPESSASPVLIVKLEEGGDVSHTTGPSSEETSSIHQMDLKIKDEAPATSQNITMDGPDSLKYVCRHCGLMFYLQEDYLHHLNKQHGCDIKQVTLELLDAKLELCDSSINNLQTKIEENTNEAFPLMIDSKDRNIGQFEPVTNERLNMPTQGETNQYKCDVCGRGFINGTRHACRVKHAKTDTGEKPYKCYVCGKAFTQSSILKRHVIAHTGETPYKCDVCGKAFVYKHHLKVHVRTHTGEKPYKCDVCGKAFTQGSTLKLHVRTHTGEKPYKCDVCGKAFTDARTLAKHMQRHTCRRKTIQV